MIIDVSLRKTFATNRTLDSLLLIFALSWRTRFDTTWNTITIGFRPFSSNSLPGRFLPGRLLVSVSSTCTSGANHVTTSGCDHTSSTRIVLRSFLTRFNNNRSCFTLCLDPSATSSTKTSSSKPKDVPPSSSSTNSRSSSRSQCSSSGCTESRVGGIEAGNMVWYSTSWFRFWLGLWYIICI